MASPNINMRDPALYRIRRVAHHRTGDAWCIYPMYDFAHALSDAIEGITHSLCTLEFEDHRPLYDWCVANCTVPSVPRQIEFARLNLTYTVMSKRRLLTLVQEGVVDGWDDPRMPTISGLRRRGCTPEAIREFAARIGVAKRENLVDVALLEDAVRDDLNRRAPRAMAVLRPLKVVIENYPEGQVETISLPVHPDRPEDGSRAIPFSRELFIERDDFMEEPPKKFFRLAPGREVRLRGTYFLTCQRRGQERRRARSSQLRCTYDPATRDGNSPDGRKPKATIHWVSAAHAATAEVRLYDRLFTSMTPGDEADGGDWRTSLNPASLEVLTCAVEPALAGAKAGDRFQFERVGYFCADQRVGARASGVQPDRDPEGHVGASGAADRRLRGRRRMGMKRIALAGGLMAALLTTVSGQQAPKPDFDTATLAWDRGDYVAALSAYKALLTAPGGEQWLEPIALQTGELFQTRCTGLTGWDCIKKSHPVLC